jgi:hypothetical protein
VKITERDILETKRIPSFGGYIVAEEEADSLCAYMVKNGNAWGASRIWICSCMAVSTCLVRRGARNGYDV